ncbi:MAG: DegT/DnrJ/EryC1/StrS family aminotransferase [Parcubacteria group bacterium]|nr:DegT/DnrJ/EryC1/StrS family aminotransferase [Parcubacteria group bacterium]
MNELFLKLKIINALAGIVLKGKNVGDFILGKSVRIFERALAEYAGSKYAFGVASGTDALILSLKACGIGPGDEVIVPAVGFYSSAGAVSWVNAKPVFVDVSPKDHNIDVLKIEKAISPKTKAIIIVHLNGRMADMDEILRIAEKRSLKVIVDASHAIGSRYREKPIGNFGDLICLSLNPTKTLGGCGDGGVILANDEALAQKISRLRIYGASRWIEVYWNNAIVGTASRLGTLEAAVLNEKLPYLDSFINRQRENYFIYKEILGNIKDLEWPEEYQDYFINGYRLPILTKRRDDLINYLSNKGEKLYNMYPVPLPYLPVFKNLGYKEGDFKVAEKIAGECKNYIVRICFPMSSVINDIPYKMSVLV